MFTGIIEERGHVRSRQWDGGCLQLRIHGPHVLDGTSNGDSIAVGGTCLTVVHRDQEEFTIEAMGETLARTTLGDLQPGSTVNLERPARVDSRLGGHIVQGHVDSVGRIEQIWSDGGARVLQVQLPAGIARYVAQKGSITLDGVSLTVSALGQTTFEVSLIPATLERTALGGLQPGDQVNIETDLIARHLERLLEYAPGAAAPVQEQTA